MRSSRSRVYAKTRSRTGYYLQIPLVTYELQDFVKEQEERQAEMAEGLVRFSADVQQVARSACDDVVDAFLKQAGIVADHRMTFMERAAFRSECRKLTRFLEIS